MVKQTHERRRHYTQPPHSLQQTTEERSFVRSAVAPTRTSLIQVNACFRQLLQVGRMEDILESKMGSWSRALRAVLTAFVMGLTVLSLDTASVAANAIPRSEPPIGTSTHSAATQQDDCSLPTGNFSYHCQLPTVMVTDNVFDAKHPIWVISIRRVFEGQADRTQHRPNDPLRPPRAVSDFA